MQSHLEEGLGDDDTSIEAPTGRGCGVISLLQRIFSRGGQITYPSASAGVELLSLCDV